MVHHDFDLAQLYGKHYVEGMVSGRIGKFRNIMVAAEDQEGHHCCRESLQPFWTRADF